MEVRLNKRDFKLRSAGRVLPKQVKNSAKQAVEFGIEFGLQGWKMIFYYRMGVWNNCMRVWHCFFKNMQIKWVKCGRRKDRLLAKYVSFFEGDIVVIPDSERDGLYEGAGHGT